MTRNALTERQIISWLRECVLQVTGNILGSQAGSAASGKLTVNEPLIES